MDKPRRNHVKDMAISKGNSEPFKFSSILKRASHGFAKRDAKFPKVPPNCVAE